MGRHCISHNHPQRPTPVEVGTIPAKSKSDAIRKPLQFEARAFDEEAFREMVAKGTKAWADVPENWLEDLREDIGDE